MANTEIKLKVGSSGSDPRLLAQPQSRGRIIRTFSSGVMRQLPLILAAASLSGCASGMFMSGKHQKVFVPGTPRSAVIQELGKPYSSRSETVSSKLPLLPGEVRRRVTTYRSDTYYTREVIPDWTRASSASMTAAMTMGLSELVHVPSALGHFIPRPKRLTVVYGGQDQLFHWDLENLPRKQR